MIMQQENILKEGTPFKFKTAPIDPNDPFRGKFVVLNYEANRYTVTDGQPWFQGDPVFVKIQNDSAGFAEIVGLERVAPTDGQHFIKAEIGSVWNQHPMQIRIKYPFERFYMEEHKAPKAEAMFRDLWSDSSSTVYGLVVVHQGKAALEDVLVDGVSISEAVLKVSE